jgi:hypothetical protein
LKLIVSLWVTELSPRGLKELGLQTQCRDTRRLIAEIETEVSDVWNDV